jgi:peptide-methionine (S)-S-oxide reductase
VFLALVGIRAATPATEKAVFAAGCFWSVELAFQRVPGVISTSVGYAGGKTQGPTYRDVTTGTTGHAEAVEVEYDPMKLPFEKLLSFFWNIHDPTTLNRQGGDIGTQYRSAIFYNTDEQFAAIKRSLEASPEATTEIRQMDSNFKYWPAEKYHQQYLEKGGQDATKGSLKPIQCYGNRGPIKKMDKPAILDVLRTKKEL